ncbi:MAG: tellurite resistance/C4-dicarboxylate transporter family protein [Candidatus Obscuribacterales bacterium]|nr:tellurite resistance/C4-dicarboxylate transporter family protein [Cyanobacteria bacterium SZAS LIN-5]
MLATLKQIILSLNPAYFAMVMSTGIVSIASNLLGFRLFAECLFWLNAVLFVSVWLLTICRLIFYFPSFFIDLTDHTRGVGVFTAVAATSVFGTQCLLLWKANVIAGVLWVISFVLWLTVTYTVFTALTIKEDKPSLAEGINGGWLLSVVATQSVCILGNLLVPTGGPLHQPMLFLSIVLWLCGGMLYIWLIALIFYRYTFFKFLPTDFAPPYWINMGAVSISTLAGTRLIDNASDWKFLEEILPFVKGFTLLFWSTGTWWIPMLVTLAIWRHAYKKVPIAYDAGYWGLVFPLGMYTAATFRLAGAIGLSFLYIIPQCFIYIAIIAWAVTFTGFLHRLYLVCAGKKQTL